MTNQKFSDPVKLSDIVATTLHHYHQRAKQFWLGTKDHDVSQNYAALLEALPKTKSLKILDLGCGPGRDLKYFKELGHEVLGVDGCAEFCQMARDYSGCTVWQQDFRKLELPQNFFDGIFANASLFHVPRLDLPRVLNELQTALLPHGILFSSNPRGQGESFDGERYAFCMELEEYQEYLSQAGFEILHHYYRPTGKPMSEQPWLAVVSCRIFRESPKQP